MKHWTPEAEERLAAYLDDVLALAQAHSDDAEDFLEDLRTHIRRDAEATAGGLVTPQNLDRALAAAGTPYDVVGIEAGAPTIAQRNGKTSPEGDPIHLNVPITIVCGILLPLAAVVAEIVLMVNDASGGLGVMPTFMHLFLLLGVPICFGFLQNVSYTPAAQQPLWKRRAVAFGVGYLFAITSLYCCALFPLFPVSLIAILFFGIGFVGLSPIFALIATFAAVTRLTRGGYYGNDLESTRRRWSVGGFAFVSVLLVGSLFHSVFLVGNLRQAVEAPAAKRNDALHTLRIWGFPDLAQTESDDRLLARFWDAKGNMYIPRVSALQEAYFQVYGEVAVDSDLRSWWYLNNVFGNRQQRLWQQGGDKVGTKIANLSLRQSTMNIDMVSEGMAAQGLSYTEWIMEFDNANSDANEARCLIALPPGGVASRLTLWIDGEEREAAFGGRSQVKAAYREVAVVQRRDPALLTTAGRDSVFLQCFPVPARGRMKLKIGVTAPLRTIGDQAFLPLPYIVSENFDLEDGFAHGLNITSPSSLSLVGGELNAPNGASGVFNYLGDISEGDLNRHGAGAILSMDNVSTPGPHEGRLGSYVATLLQAPAAAPVKNRNVCLVIDGSAGVGRANIDWSAFIKAFPEDVSLRACLASDGGHLWDGAGGRDGLIDWLNTQTFEFGQPLVKGLMKLWSETMDISDREFIVIHGPQPLDDSHLERFTQALKQSRWNGGGQSVSLVAATPGPIRMLEALDGYKEIQKVPVIDSVQATLERLARTGHGTDDNRTYTLEKNAATAETSGKHGTSSHVVRMAALNEVMNLLAVHSPLESKEATRLAQRCRLVTPVSGAVVLETKAQYERHGLDDDENLDAVPAVPEPEEWLLIIIALCAVTFILYKTQRKKVAA